MSTFTFRAATPPFRRWMGPFSPTPGVTYGLRVREGRLGTYMQYPGLQEFCTAQGSAAADLAALVRRHWGGGRVLLLPYGLVIKPLREEYVGKRALIGWFEGGLWLDSEFYAEPFDLSDPGDTVPGGLWPLPDTIGLQCVIAEDGSLSCTWYHPDARGHLEERYSLRGPDPQLSAGFRRCRPGDGAGRVHLLPNGHVITKRRISKDEWESRYVGHVDRHTLRTSNDWISRDTA